MILVNAKFCGITPG